MNLTQEYGLRRKCSCNVRPKPGTVTETKVQADDSNFWQEILEYGTKIKMPSEI